MIRLLTAVFLLALLSCNSEEEIANGSAVPRVELAPSAIIGSGDFAGETSFGAICDVDFLEDGTIVVLDRMKGYAAAFSRSGEYLFSIGAPGEGPGEFVDPDFMTPVEGGLVVFEKESAKASLFDLDGVYQGELEGSGTFQIPNYCCTAGDSMLVGGVTAMDETGGEMAAMYMVLVCDMSLHASDTLYTHRFTMEYGNFSGMLRNTAFSCSFAGDHQGNVFISPASTEEYRIMGFDRNGEMILELDLEKEMVERSQEEITREQERFNSVLSARNPGFSQSYQPLECRYMIPPNGIHTDDLGRIWVRDGLADGPEFDVYNYSGEVLFTAVTSGIDPWDTNDVLWWSVGEYGLLCFSIDPYENPVVYFFPIPEV